MTNAQALAIAASAYNVCGPRSGPYATPSTVKAFGRNIILRCMVEYAETHDGSCFARAEIVEARDIIGGAT